MAYNLMTKKSEIEKECEEYNEEIRKIKQKSRSKKIILLWYDILAIFYMNQAIKHIEINLLKDADDNEYYINNIESTTEKNISQEIINGISDIVYDNKNNIFISKDEDKTLQNPLKDRELESIFNETMMENANKKIIENFINDIFYEKEKPQKIILSFNSHHIKRIKILLTAQADNDKDQSELLNLASELFLENIII